MPFDSTCIMASNIGIVNNLHNKLWFLYINRLDPGRLYLKLLHSPHWPQHSIRFSYVMGVFIVVPVTFYTEFLNIAHYIYLVEN